MSKWFYPCDFPPEFNSLSPAYTVAICRERLLRVLEDAVPNADILTRQIDALLEAKIAERLADNGRSES